MKTQMRGVKVLFVRMVYFWVIGALKYHAGG
jgi:hypothetical protein